MSIRRSRVWRTMAKHTVKDIHRIMCASARTRYTFYATATSRALSDDGGGAPTSRKHICGDSRLCNAALSLSGGQRAMKCSTYSKMLWHACAFSGNYCLAVLTGLERLYFMYVYVHNMCAPRLRNCVHNPHRSMGLLYRILID